MKLYLIRHAHAVSAEENPLRPLSKRGRRQVAQLAAFFRLNGALRPAAFWHTPLARSRETAKLLVAGLRLTAPLIRTTGLVSEDDAPAIAKRVSLVPRDLAIVGHEPHLGALATLLTHGPGTPAAFAFKKGAVLALEGKNGKWLIRWCVSPEMLGPG